jgi:hypothetical protein
MHFTKIRFNDEETLSWKVQPGDMIIPNDPDNRHCKLVLEDIADGAAVLPYVDSMTPYQHWHNDINKLDKDMSRSMEDILDGMADKSGVAQISLDRLQSKKDLRALKP